MDDFLNGLGIVVGVTAGAIAGTGVALMVQAVNARRLEDRKVGNLRFELEFNVKKVETWLAMLGEYRNAVSVSAPAQFVGYFDLTRLLFVTANDMLASGLLYKNLTHEDIRRLMTLSSGVNLYYENQINGEIQVQRQSFNRAVASERILFWETQFKEHHETLQGILSSLEG